MSEGQKKTPMEIVRLICRKLFLDPIYLYVVYK